MAGVSRRGLLMVGVGGILAAGVGAVAVAVTSRGEPSRIARGRAAARLFGDDLDDARHLGVAYLDEEPDDPVVRSNGAVPPGAVPRDVGDGAAWFVAAAPAALADQAASGCREDFAAGQVPEVAGWRLPLTALQLCAIAARDT